jgi:hypothetical protein
VYSNKNRMSAAAELCNNFNNFAQFLLCVRTISTSGTIHRDMQ